MRIRLNDLAPGVNYVIRLRSTNGVDYSEWSRAFDLLTSSDTIAPKTPEGVSGSMSGTSFNLAWSAVVESADNSPARDLDHYEVLVASGGTGTTKVYSTSDNKFQFTLEMNREVFGSPRANIILSVRAVDKTGNASAYSSTVSQTNAAPSAPTAFSGASLPDAVALKWTGVTDADLLMYRVYSGTTVGSQTSLVWSGLSTQTTIQRVDYFVDQWYKVVAVDVFGTESTGTVAGPYKPESPFGVDSTAPSVPTGLTATLTTTSDASRASAAVSWSAVTDTDGDLAGYRIGYKPVGASDWEYTDVDYTLTSTLIDRLIPYINYEFRVRSYDWSANFSVWSATFTTNTAATNTAPSTPTAPSVAGATQNVQVSIPGTKAAGGAMEADVKHYEVYASTTTGFTPSTANMLGIVINGPAMIGTFPVPATGTGTTQTWYVKIIAVDQLGLKSSASAQATATPGLILTANIGDAQITSAKIGSVEANKIVAGDGLINDLTVKSTLTLGDAGTDGVIKSFDWVSNTTGYRMTKNSLEINGGSIAAGALKIQMGTNLLPPKYAGFEFSSTSYTLATLNTTASIVTTTPKYQSQCLRVILTATASQKYVVLGNSLTDYHTIVDGTPVIMSVWVFNPGATAVQFKLNVRGNTGNYYAGSTETIAAGAAWTRYWATFNLLPGTTSVVPYLEFFNSDGGNISVDGVQIEKIVGGLTTPSLWKPPGVTSVEGGILRTGSIISNTSINVSGVDLPAFSINMDGNIQVGEALVRGRLVVGTVGETHPNLAPSSGNFESTDTGFSVYQIGATGTAHSRTTTVGEVISGTGSGKVIAAAGAKTRLGSQFSTPENYTAGTKVRLAASVKVNTTDAGSTLRLVFLNQFSAIYEEVDIISEPVAGTVYNINYTHTVPDGSNLSSVAFVHAGAITTTMFIIDNVVLENRTKIGPSYVTSADYQEGLSGWRIFADGNVEFNDGVFRGTLGASTVTSESLSSDLVLSTVIRAGIDSSNRVELGPSGVQLYGSDNTISVDLTTDPTKSAFFKGDLLANSLTVADQMAIRGSVNELSRGATLTVASGTTAPSSPPNVTVGWQTLNTSDSDPNFNPYRYGLASDGSNFLFVQDVYGLGCQLRRINRTTGAIMNFDNTRFAHVWSGVGGMTVLNGVAYILGKNILGAWTIEGRNITTGALTLNVPYNNTTPKYGPVIGSDPAANELLVGYIRQDNKRLWYQRINPATGSGIAQVETGYTSSAYHDLAYIERAAHDHGSTKVVFAKRNYNKIYVLNGDGTVPSSSAELEFYNGGQIHGMTWADFGSGGAFYTHDATGSRMYFHSSAIWSGSSTSSSKWHVGNTWYDSNATGGTHETQIGPLKTFTMQKRAGLQITTAPLPIRPDPTTTDDAVAVGIYMARNSSTPTNAQLERQGYLADGVTNVYYHRNGGSSVNLPVAGVSASFPPPTTNGFAGLAAANATIRSANDNFFVSGDGSGEWGAMAVSNTGVISIPQQLFVKYDSGSFTVPNLANGASGSQNVTFEFTFPQAPRVLVSHGSSRVNVVVGSVTTTGMTISYANWSGNATGSTSTGYWMAWVE